MKSSKRIAGRLSNKGGDRIGSIGILTSLFGFIRIQSKGLPQIYSGRPSFSLANLIFYFIAESGTDEFCYSGIL